MTSTPLSPEQLAAEFDGFNAAVDVLGPAVGSKFPYHAQQEYALSAYTDNVLVLGGNQSGKTTVGLAIAARVIRREGPIYRRLLRPEGRPLKIWVCPNLNEKYKSNWEDRLVHEAFAGVEHTYVQSPHPLFTWKDEFGGGTLWGKSQEQGFMAFESDEVDLILFDEEPLDRRLYTSAQTRVSGTNGVIALLFTPLNGITWTYGALYLPAAVPERERAPRVWVDFPRLTIVEMGMADNPHSVDGGGVERLKNDPSISESERQTRLYGKYGFTEGLIFPMFADLSVHTQRCPYIIDALPEARPYNWYFLADPNKRHGGLLAAVDHVGNRYYCGEHYAENLPDRLHAASYRVVLKAWAKRINLALRDVPDDKIDVAGQVVPFVDFWADPGGAGAQAILNMADVGIYAKPVPKDAGSVHASIDLIRRAAWIDPTHRHPLTGQLGAPHIYFLRSLKSSWTWEGVKFLESRLMWELRQYRQKENAAPNTPIKEKDDCVDTMRYLELVRPFTPAPKDMRAEEERGKLDPLSQRAAEEFDELVARQTRPKSTFEPL